MAHAEPVFDSGVTAPLGGLWSCVTDLLRYADFIAEPDAAVPGRVDGRGDVPAHRHDRPGLLAGCLRSGLRDGAAGDRVYVGHGGAMPGFLTGLMVSRPDRLGAVVSAELEHDRQVRRPRGRALTTVLDAMPTAPTPWAPEAAGRPRRLAGLWWTEGSPLELFVEQGRLSAMLERAGMTSVTRFVAEGGPVPRCRGPGRRSSSSSARRRAR